MKLSNLFVQAIERGDKDALLEVSGKYTNLVALPARKTDYFCILCLRNKYSRRLKVVVTCYTEADFLHTFKMFSYSVSEGILKFRDLFELGKVSEYNE